MHEVMEVQKSANCNLRGYFNQLFFSCRAGNIYTALYKSSSFYATVPTIFLVFQLKRKASSNDLRPNVRYSLGLCVRFICPSYFYCKNLSSTFQDTI